jgi:hypothetical protein
VKNNSEECVTVVTEAGFKSSVEIYQRLEEKSFHGGGMWRDTEAGVANASGVAGSPRRNPFSYLLRSWTASRGSYGYAGLAASG